MANPDDDYGSMKRNLEDKEKENMQKLNQIKFKSEEEINTDNAKNISYNSYSATQNQINNSLIGKIYNVDMDEYYKKFSYLYNDSPIINEIKDNKDKLNLIGSTKSSDKSIKEFKIA